HPHWLVYGKGPLRFGQKLDLSQSPQHHVSTLPGQGRMFRWRIGVGTFDQGRDQRHFFQAKLLEGLPKQAMGRLADAVNRHEPGLSEIDFIEITLQDLRLFVLCFQHKCRQSLLEFSHHSAMRRVKEILGQLLCDGTASLHYIALREIPPQRATDRNRIDASVRIEAVIFDGDDYLDQPRWNLTQGNPFTNLARFSAQPANQFRLEIHRKDRRALNHRQDLDNPVMIERESDYRRLDMFLRLRVKVDG